jgi:hypothetical protein
MLEAITGVAVAFCASEKRTFIRFFKCVTSNVNFEVFSSREGFFAAVEVTNVRFLFCVSSTMHKHLISSIETSIRSLTTFPVAVVKVVETNRTVSDADVICELF